MSHKGEITVEVTGLHFKHESRKTAQSFLDVSGRFTRLDIGSFVAHRGERVLICGCNGAGKSTFLSILGGRRMIPMNVASIYGRDCFSDCTLGSKVCYLGDWWRTDFFLDCTISSFLGEQVCNSDRCKSLGTILQVAMDWRISQLSDGQRRRCQILSALTLSDDFEIYILDEVTADLDIVSRERLLMWLKEETLTRGATVLLATHIMDGMDEWATRMIYLEDGGITRDLPVTRDMELFRIVREWMMSKYSQNKCFIQRKMIHV